MCFPSPTPICFKPTVALAAPQQCGIGCTALELAERELHDRKIKNDLKKRGRSVTFAEAPFTLPAVPPAVEAE